MPLPQVATRLVPDGRDAQRRTRSRSSGVSTSIIAALASTDRDPDALPVLERRAAARGARRARAASARAWRARSRKVAPVGVQADVAQRGRRLAGAPRASRGIGLREKYSASPQRSRTTFTTCVSAPSPASSGVASVAIDGVGGDASAVSERLERRDRGLDVAGSSIGRSPCTLTMMSAVERRSPPRRCGPSRTWSRARHHRLAALALDRRRDALVVGRDEHAVDAARQLGAAQTCTIIGLPRSPRAPCRAAGSTRNAPE